MGGLEQGRHGFVRRHQRVVVRRRAVRPVVGEKRQIRPREHRGEVGGIRYLAAERIGVGTLFFLANCAQFEAELEAIEALKAQGDWLQTPVEDAFDDLTDEDIDPDPNNNEDDDDALLARRAPTIDPKAFYGILDKIVTETTRESEATKVGVAAQIMAHVSLCPRPFYNPLGDNNIPFNGYFVQVGPSGKGRKGTSAVVADKNLDLLCSGRRDARRRASRSPTKTRPLATRPRRRSRDPTHGLPGRGASARPRKPRSRAGWSCCGTTTPQWRGDRRTQSAPQGQGPRPAHGAGIREADRGRRGEARQHRRIDRRGRGRIGRSQAGAEGPGGGVKQAEADHDAAEAKLNELPPPAPWLALFAALADGPVIARGVSSGEGLIEKIRDPGQKSGPHGPVHDPGVDVKCLFINLDELGSALAVMMRPGRRSARS